MNRPWHGSYAPLREGAFRRAAEELGCEEAALRAVWEVESSGRYFTSDGVVRRFEPHKMPRETWEAIGFEPLEREPAWRASLALTRTERRMMFEEAYKIDPERALESASWGAPQIMGFNFAAAGFTSAREMVTAMAQAADAHLNAFVRLVQSWGLDAALRGHDWLGFARRYNGSGRPEEYARRMEAAYRRHSGAKSPVVLRVGDRGEAVRRLQAALDIEADGVFGPETERAVMAFQESVKLPVDGIVGARTWQALEAATAAPTAPAQDDTVDKILDRSRDISGAASGASMALSPILDRLSDNMMTIVLIFAGIAGIMALGFWLVRRHRRHR